MTSKPSEKGRPSPQKAPLNCITDTHRKHINTAPAIFSEDQISAYFASRYLPNLSESLSARASGYSSNRFGPWLLPPIPRIAINVARSEQHSYAELGWFDAASGSGGRGVISLVAHVLKVPPNEALRRSEAFLGVLMGDYLPIAA